MANILLATGNHVDSVTNFYGADADVALPYANLKDTVFAKVWRFTPGTNADGNYARLAFALPGIPRTNHLALCRHNLGARAQIRLRAGMSRLDADFTTDKPFDYDILWSGGANGTRTNEYGVMVAATCPRYEHDRRYPLNALLWSDDLTQSSAWSADGGAIIYADGLTVDFAGAGGRFLQSFFQLYADTYELVVQARLTSGNGDFVPSILGSNLGAMQTATTEWKTFTVPIACGAGGALLTSSAYLQIAKQTAAGTIQFRGLQLSRGSAAGKCRKTTTQRLYRRIGLITEAAATNSLIQSHVYTNAAWTKTSVTVGAGAGTAPDGTNTISSLPGTAGTSSVAQSFAAGGTTSRALSLIFKAGGTSTSASLNIGWNTGGVAQSVTCNFNPSTGAFISQSATGATLNGAGVQDLGGGFFRAYVMGTGTLVANTNLTCSIGWNVSGTLLAWGMQGEANFVTTYIPTTTTTLTRTVDTAEVETATWVPYALNPTEGTLYHEVQTSDIPCDSTRTISVAALYNSAGIFQNDVISRLIYTAGVGYQVDAGAWVSSVNTWLAGNVAVAANSVVRSVVRYRATDFRRYVNGASNGSSASAVPTGMNRIALMREPSCTAYVRRVALLPTGKADADMQAMSATGPGAVDYDSGWEDVMQARLQGDVPATWGQDYDVLKTFPMRGVEWMRVEIYDPAKTSSSTPFDIGRAFVGKLVLQPAKNAEYGMQYSWRERTTSDEAVDGRKFFNERPRIRELVFSFPKLTPPEAAVVHEMQGSGGTSQEVLVLTDPDDEADCQRFGFVGYLSKLDPITYPLVNVRAAAFQLEKKR